MSGKPIFHLGLPGSGLSRVCRYGYVGPLRPGLQRVNPCNSILPLLGGCPESCQNQGGHTSYVQNCGGGLDGQDRTAACGRLQPVSVTRSIVKFLYFRGRKTPPFRRTRGNLVTTRASFLVSHLPMPNHNVTKRKSPQVYHLSTPVEGVDGEV